MFASQSLRLFSPRMRACGASERPGRRANTFLRGNRRPLETFLIPGTASYSLASLCSVNLQIELPFTYSLYLEPQAAAHLEAIKARHRNIQQDEVRLILFGGDQARLAIHRGIDLEPLKCESFLEEGQNLQIIVYQ